MIKRLMSLILAISIVLTSGCASVLNGKFQKISVITNSEDATVFVNDANQGKGVIVKARMQRDFNAKQIRVERPGYKPEYSVHRQTKKSWLVFLSWVPFGVLYLIPPLLDRGPKAFNYEKEISVQNKIKVNEKSADQKYMVLKNVKFDVKAEDFLIEQTSFKRFSKGKGSKKGQQSTALENINVDNTIFSNAVNAALLETGYIDTSNSLLKSKSNNTYVNASVTKMKFNSIYSSKGYYNRSLICEATITWEFLDKYDQVKVKKSSSAKSGEFCVYVSNSVGDAKDSELNVIQRCVQDAITNSFYEIVQTKEAKEWLKSTSDSLPKEILAPIVIEKGAAVKDIKSGIEATTIVITNKGHGSGCVVGTGGYLVTSFHVVAGVDSAIKVLFKDGDTAIATVVRYSEFADLALLKVEKKCKYAFNVVQNPEYEIGDEIFAIGTPASIELGQTVSKGIISGFRKELEGRELIQTDVSVNPGNSGGALLKKDGTFIGIVNAKISGKGLEGLGFCSPSKQIFDFLKVSFK